jgi:hypothetical protein
MIFGPNYANPSLIVDTTSTFTVTELFNHPSTRSCEAPSCNGHASARAMAKIASVMAAHGTAHDVELLSKETSMIAQGNPTIKFDKMLFQNTKFCAGGWSIFDSKFAYNRQGSMGWFGIGGSALQWHHEFKIGFGYACNLFGAELGNKNSALVQNAVIDCARKIHQQQNRYRHR